MVTQSNTPRSDRKSTQPARPVQDILLELTRQLHATRVVHVLPAQPTVASKA